MRNSGVAGGRVRAGSGGVIGGSSIAGEGAAREGDSLGGKGRLCGEVRRQKTQPNKEGPAQKRRALLPLIYTCQ